MALEGARTELLRTIRDSLSCPAFTEILSHIQEVVAEDDPQAGKSDPLAKLCRSIFIVKEGRCSFLDISRTCFLETSEASQALIASYNDDEGLPPLTSAFAAKRGFFLRCSASDYSEREAATNRVFSQVSKKGKIVTLSSAELNALNTRLLDAAADAILLSQTVLDSSLAFVGERLAFLYALHTAVSLLDLQHSYAVAVAGACPAQWVRPSFSADGPVAIQNGRHPVLDRRPDAEVVPNSFFLSEAASLVLVGGPNASGKTTYLRTCASIAILALAGCFVPASFASIPLLDRVFCVGLSQCDQIDESASSFMVECRELAHALKHATSSSLVVIDELGRATSTADAFALSFAACERLLSVGALTLLASHLERLSELSERYPSAKRAHLTCKTAGAGLAPLYTLSTEPAPASQHYGLALASTAGFSASLLAEAAATASRIEAAGARAPIATEGGEQHTHCAVATRLLLLSRSSLAEGPLRDALRRLKSAVSQ